MPCGRLPHAGHRPPLRPHGLLSRRAGLLQAGGLVLVLASLTAVSSACTVTTGNGRLPQQGPPARTRIPPAAAGVLPAIDAGTLAAGAAEELFASAPVAVLTRPGRPGGLAAAAALARRIHAPLLLARMSAASQGTAVTALNATGRAAGLAMARAVLTSLRCHTVLTVGLPGGSLTAGLPGVRVVSGAAAVPASPLRRPLRSVALLVRGGDDGAGVIAAAATARAAGAELITVHGSDPRADPAAVRALAAARPGHVLAAGSAFGPPARLAARVAVAETGVQLPGGGQVLFPGRRLVALYGHPGAPALGALGRQDLTASIARARAVAARYRRLSSVPVVPAFEIIAAVAEGSPGPDGSYSAMSSVATLRPWVRRATAAGLYVVLDLQPGRASLLAQARAYRRLLALPDVGLGLDPEWQLQPGQLPLQQIGSVSAGAVNAVTAWLAGLTARHHLPQKLVVLHQFRLSMISDENALDTRHDDLAIVVHMDGQGTPGVKQQTWDAITTATPPGVFFGWKNFYTEDHPMMTPRQTMTRQPAPVMISYQ